MEQDHYAKSQEGREQGVTIRKYLLALSGETQLRPGRDMSKQLEKLKSELALCTNPLQKVKLMQRLYNLENGVPETEQLIDLAALEKKFIAVVKPYSERNGIVREVWIGAGVPESVLDNAQL